MQKLKVIAPGRPWIALMKDRGRSIIEYDMGFAMPPLAERAVDRLRTYLEDYQHANSRALTRTTPKVGPSNCGGSVEAHGGECGSPLLGHAGDAEFLGRIRAVLDPKARFRPLGPAFEPPLETPNEAVSGCSTR